MLCRVVRGHAFGRQPKFGKHTVPQVAEQGSTLSG